jgi:hypothetical protein
MPSIHPAVFPAFFFRILILMAVATGFAGAEPTYDEVIALNLVKLRNGKTLTETDMQTCHAAQLIHFQKLDQENEGPNYSWPEPARTDFFLDVTKMSMIYPKEHAGWPTRSTLSEVVLPELKDRMEKDTDPHLRFCAIFPALKRNEKELAISLYEELLESDRFLANQVIIFSTNYYDKHGEPGWIVSYYLATGDEEKVEQARKDAITAIFPEGLKKVTLDNFTAEPSDGVVFSSRSEPMATHNLEVGTVAVAVDGYRVRNMQQYSLLRDRKAGEMELIIWDGLKYRELKASLPNRLWAAYMTTYTPF